MKKKRESCKRAMLVLLFTLAATALLVGTAAAVTHTEVESVTRYAPAGPAADEEFEVTLKISYSELPLVVGIVETIPEGFSFVSTTHPSDQYEVSGQKVAFAVINETEITYKVKAPSSGDGTFTGEWVDLLVLTTELEEGKERWETIADTIVIVGGGGAGTIEEEGRVTPTPTPFVPEVTKATRSIPVIEAGKAVAMIFEDMDVRLITLKADANVSEAKVVVERIERTPDIPEPSGILYTYLDIGVENAGGAEIEGRVEFKVGKSWIADNNIDEATVKLNRYVGREWNALPTSKIGEDADFVYFEAKTPGFSTFAVTGEKKVVVEATAAVPTPTVAAPTPAATATPASEEVPGFEVIFATVSLLVVYMVMFRKKVKGGDMK
jgi:PGF-pre-PGF domain-containing protein